MWTLQPNQEIQAHFYEAICLQWSAIKEDKKRYFPHFRIWDTILLIYVSMIPCRYVQMRSWGHLLHHWAAQRSWLLSIQQRPYSPKPASPQSPGSKADISLSAWYCVVKHYTEQFSYHGGHQHHNPCTISTFYYCLFIVIRLTVFAVV